MKPGSMQKTERFAARRYDTPGRCREFTDLVYSGADPDPAGLAARVFSVEKDFYPPEPEYRLFFGEMHGHTDLSDGETDIDAYFRNIRDRAGLDFAALTDHDHGGIGHAELWNDGKILPLGLTMPLMRCTPSVRKQVLNHLKTHAEELSV